MKAGKLLHAAVYRSSGEILVTESGQYLVSTNKAELTDLANDRVLGQFFEVRTYREAVDGRTLRTGPRKKKAKRVAKSAISPKLLAARRAAGRKGAAKRWAKRRAKKASKKG